MKPSVFHVRARGGDSDYGTHRIGLVVGVCAVGRTDATRIVTERLCGDGYLNVLIADCTRVAPQGTWLPGDTLVYGEWSATDDRT